MKLCAPHEPIPNVESYCGSDQLCLCGVYGNSDFPVVGDCHDTGERSGTGIQTITRKCPVWVS